MEEARTGSWLTGFVMGQVQSNTQLLITWPGCGSILKKVAPGSRLGLSSKAFHVIKLICSNCFCPKRNYFSTVWIFRFKRNEQHPNTNFPKLSQWVPEQPALHLAASFASFLGQVWAEIRGFWFRKCFTGNHWPTRMQRRSRWNHRQNGKWRPVWISNV